MKAKEYLRFVLVGVFFAASGNILAGQAGTSGQTQQKTLEKAPITRSNPASGKQMFKDYCAACHGADAKGDGPAADILKTPPPDLTLMAKNNNGTFPADHFVAVLHFGSGHAHGTSDMPVWGPLFRTQEKDLAQLRISNLEDYVKSIQQK